MLIIQQAANVDKDQDGAAVDLRQLFWIHLGAAAREKESCWEGLKSKLCRFSTYRFNNRSKATEPNQ